MGVSRLSVPRFEDGSVARAAAEGTPNTLDPKVATGLGTHKEKKVTVDIHGQAAGSQILLAQHVRAAAKFSDG